MVITIRHESMSFCDFNNTKSSIPTIRNGILMILKFVFILQHPRNFQNVLEKMFSAHLQLVFVHDDFMSQILSCCRGIVLSWNFGFGNSKANIAQKKVPKWLCQIHKKMLLKTTLKLERLYNHKKWLPPIKFSGQKSEN